MTTVGLGKNFSSTRSSSSLYRTKYLYDFTEIRQKFHSNGSHGTVGRQQGSEAVGTGSNPSLYPHFQT